MNTILAGILLNVLKMITSSSLMDHVVDVVKSVTDLTVSGEEKRALVMAKLKDVGNDFAPIITATAGYILNLAVEAAVAYVKVHTPE